MLVKTVCSAFKVSPLYPINVPGHFLASLHKYNFHLNEFDIAYQILLKQNYLKTSVKFLVAISNSSGFKCTFSFFNMWLIFFLHFFDGSPLMTFCIMAILFLFRHLLLKSFLLFTTLGAKILKNFFYHHFLIF